MALAWPRELAEEFLPYAQAHVAERERRRRSAVGDDPVVGAFCKARQLPMWATVPCLVQHPDEGYSIVKRREYKGTNPARRAVVFAP